MGNQATRAELRQAFGHAMRVLRIQRAMAQETLAERSGLDRGYTGALERGAHSPSIETVYKICVALDVSHTTFAVEYDRALAAILEARG